MTLIGPDPWPTHVWQVAIARRYLEPQAQADAGVPAGATRVTDPAMLELITEYAR